MRHMRTALGVSASSCAGVGVAVLVASAVAAFSSSTARATSCVFTVEWDGRTYSHVGSRRERRPGRSLGEGVVPACDPRQGDRDRRVRVVALRGIPPLYAVAVDGDVLAAVGYPVELPQHPAHELVFGARDEPNYRRNCRPGTTTMTGTIGSDGLDDLGEPIALDAGTEVDGLPRLNEGDRVRVRALTCEGEGPGTRLLVAASLEMIEDVRPPGDARGVDPDVVLGAAITGAIFVAAFGFRALAGRRRRRPTP
jgi:hypothetical protein